LTTGLPLPIGVRQTGLAHVACCLVDQALLGADGGGMGPWIERGTQFVALVKDPARDGCHWLALLDGKVADS
jgi:hypothetical protein